jgi:Protein of unknown function (DUF3105)
MAKKRGKKKRPAPRPAKASPAKASPAKAGSAKAGSAKSGAPTKSGAPKAGAPAKAAPGKAAPGKSDTPAKSGAPAKSDAPAKSGAAAPAAGARRPTKAERIEAVQRRQRRRRLVRRAVVGGVLLLLVGGVAAVVISNRRASERTISRMEAGGCRFDRESDSDEGQGRNHVTGSVAYRTNPPAGGNHSATPSAPSIYEQPPPDEQVVHAMEHGDIVLWHKPDVPPETLDRFRALSDRYEGDVLVVPRASLPTPVAATAWHRRLQCPSFEQAAFDLFVRTYRDKGPEKVPEG